MRKWMLRAVCALVVVLVLAGIAVWLSLRASLPTLDGDVALNGLDAPVSIERMKGELGWRPRALLDQLPALLGEAVPC